MMSESTSSWLQSSYLISTTIDDVTNTLPPPVVTITPSPISRSGTDFIYVEYDDYDEYSSYEVPSDLSGTPDTIPSTTSAKTAPPHLPKAKTTPMMPHATVPTVTADGRSQTAPPVKSSSPTTRDPDDTFTAFSAGRSLQSTSNPTEPETVTPSPSSFFSLSRKENNSVDEVQYRIVGLDGDATKGQQNYFVPRMPPFRERTHNKRIQQLLNEKRRQDLMRRPTRTGARQTDRKH